MRLNPFALVTLPPAGLITLGAVLGGYWPLAALIWLTLLAGLADRILSEPAALPADDLWSERLSFALGLLHLVLLPMTIWAVLSPNLGGGATLALFLATASFMGQVSHPNAHDLIHHQDARARALGIATYGTLLYGQHNSAHRYVHHIHVGTPLDPSTPLPGEGVWSYLPRAWIGNFMAAWEAEDTRLRQRGKAPWAVGNPFWQYLGWALASLTTAALIGGFIGAITLLALAMLTQLQILLSDYIQHYGLQRQPRPLGGYEPIGLHHSWNSPGGFSALLMLNAARHGEHHLNAGRPFQTLAPNAQPTLPQPMAIMAVLALFPDAWRKRMDPRAIKVMEAAHPASPESQNQPARSEEDLARVLRG